MNNLNSVLIEGALTCDAVLKHDEKGASVCNFSLASSRIYRQEGQMMKEVSHFDIEARAKLAEHCFSLGHKG